MNVNDYARQYSRLHGLGWPEDKFEILFNHPVIFDTQEYGFFNHNVYFTIDDITTRNLMENIIGIVCNVRYSDNLFFMTIQILDDINKKYIKRLKSKQMRRIKKSAKEFVI